MKNLVCLGYLAAFALGLYDISRGEFVQGIATIGLAGMIALPVVKQLLEDSLTDDKREDENKSPL